MTRGISHPPKDGSMAIFSLTDGEFTIVVILVRENASPKDGGMSHL